MEGVAENADWKGNISDLWYDNERGGVLSQIPESQWEVINMEILLILLFPIFVIIELLHHK